MKNLSREIHERVMIRLLRESKEMGKIPFSPNRTDGAPTDERDTEIEREIWDALSYRVLGSTSDEPTYISPQGIAALQKLLKTKAHPEITSPPGGRLYRGFGTTLKGLEAIVGPAHWGDMLKYFKGSIPPKGSFTFKTPPPELKGGYMGDAFQSWSPDRGTATGYARAGGGDTHRVTATATVKFAPPGTFLDLRPIVAACGALGAYHEAEVLSLGPVPLESLSWDATEGE